MLVYVVLVAERIFGGGESPIPSSGISLLYSQCGITRQALKRFRMNIDAFAKHWVIFPLNVSLRASPSSYRSPQNSLINQVF